MSIESNAPVSPPHQKTGILLVNLGTPESFSTGDVRKYLREFLSDPRVIDIHPLGRFLLVNLIIAPFRSPRSARLYKKIWTKNGSPLLYYTKRQNDLLQVLLGHHYQVEFAMRYQSPSLNEALLRFRDPLFRNIKVIPLFPQYASATTGSVHEMIMNIVRKWQVIPEIEFINNYCNHPAFIKAFADTGNRYHPGQFDHILFSFHGLPQRQIVKADYGNQCLKGMCCESFTTANANCYRAQCFETARHLARTMEIPLENYTVCFQSRLGKDPWIEPYSDAVIRKLAGEGKKRLLVFAPAFTSDCLETLYEIGIEYDELFQKHGGQKLTLVESLNDSPAWIEALKTIVLTG